MGNIDAHPGEERVQCTRKGTSGFDSGLGVNSCIPIEPAGLRYRSSQGWGLLGTAGKSGYPSSKYKRANGVTGTNGLSHGRQGPRDIYSEVRKDICATYKLILGEDPGNVAV